MKYNWDKKYLYWGITAFLVIVASVLFYYTLFRMHTIIAGVKKIYTILTPIIFGGIIAYLLTPLINFLENKIIYPGLKKYKFKLVSRKLHKAIRISCVLFTLVLSLWFIYALIAMLVPEIIKSLTAIVENFPNYINTIQNWIADLLKNNPSLDVYASDLFQRYSQKAEVYLTSELLPQVNSIVKNFSSGIFDLLIFFKNFLIGAMISIYIMVGKEKFTGKGKRILFFLTKPSTANNIIKNLKFVHAVFGGFITGKLIDSLIIGILCYIGTSLIGTPYAILISVIIGVTNVIPFFGPYLGAIPCGFLILLVNPIQCLYFAIFILVLQQFDGNFLGPKILGDSTGLSSFMVIVAILIGGELFGILGMFIGVPVCAVICALANQWMMKHLEANNLPQDLKTYTDLNYIEEDTLKPVMNTNLGSRKKASNFNKKAKN